MILTVKLIGKLDDGTVFVKKGHDGDEPFEFKTDEGNAFCSDGRRRMFVYSCRMMLTNQVLAVVNRASN